MKVARGLRRQWIPPLALLFSVLAHGLSWVLLVSIPAHDESAAMGAPAIAWIHLVVLGWFSVAALGILMHVIPGFTDVQWSHETVARESLLAFC